MSLPGGSRCLVPSSIPDLKSMVECSEGREQGATLVRKRWREHILIRAKRVASTSCRAPEKLRRADTFFFQWKSTWHGREAGSLNFQIGEPLSSTRKLCILPYLMSIYVFLQHIFIHDLRRDPTRLGSCANDHSIHFLQAALLACKYVFDWMAL